jgi:peptidoglycan/LPS O-acetylase OafA/YrhL
MAPHREALKRYCSRAMAFAIIIGAALILGGLPAWGKGLIAGALFSILNFILMAEALPHRMRESRPRAAVISLGWLLLRYCLMAVPMILALVYHLFHPAAAAIGLFFVQLVILTEHLLSSITSSSGSSA